MSGLVEHVTRWENAQLEAIFNEELKCEHPEHGAGRDAAYHGGPGEILGILPCGARAILCRSICDVLLSVGHSTCHCVQRGHAVSAANFIEL
jgi:hypothetical protein